MMLRVAVCLCFAMLVAAQQPDYNGIASKYINLGAINNQPSTQNCTRYATLFNPDGILHSPGIPDAMGWDQIEAACQESHGQVNPLLSSLETIIPVMSWDTTKRLAFSWTINGVRTRDSANVAAPAITALFMDRNANINTAWSFYDDQDVQGTGPAAPPFNVSDIVDKYVALGKINSHTPAQHDCKAWAALFNSTGVSNEPGIPPFQGTAQLLEACTLRSNRFDILVPSIQTVIPVMAWNLNKRLAFEWTIAATSGDQTFLVPCLTVLFMQPNGLIISSWDFWDTSLLPPDYAAAKP